MTPHTYLFVISAVSCKRTAVEISDGDITEDSSLDVNSGRQRKKLKKCH